MIQNENIERWVRKLRNCLQFFYTTDSQWVTMELHKGNVTLLSIPQVRNVFRTRRYNLFNFLPLTLFRAFSRIGNLFLLAISLIMLIDPSLSPFYRWITIFPMGLGVLIYIVLQAILDQMRCRQDHIINNQKTSRGSYAKHEGIVEVKWEDVQVGDILYLTKGDIVPADLILLDSGQVQDREALAMVDTQYYDGKSSLIKKKSSYLTQLIVLRTRQKSQYPEYRKLLTGKLTFEDPNGDTETFNGRLKLKKDPKHERLTIDNFIPKGSRIKQTSWLFGLVVHTGMHTKTAMSSRYDNAKSQFAIRQSNILSFLMAVLCIFFTLISIIVLLARSDDIEYMKVYDPDSSNGRKLFNMLILFSQLVPANVYLLFDIVNFINKFTLEKQLIKKDEKRFIQINSTNSVTDLGNVDYMLIDKTGTLTTSYYKLDTFLFGTAQFNLNHDQLFYTLMNHKGKKQSEIEDPIKQVSLENEYLIAMEYETNNDKQRVHKTSEIHTNRNISQRINPLKTAKTNLNSQIFKQVSEIGESQVVINQQPTKLLDQQISIRRQMYSGRKRASTTLPGTNNDEFLQMMGQYRQISPQQDYKESENENALLYDSFMKCLMLCHEARPIYTAEDIAYESFSKNEEIALTFARLCGYSLEQFNKFESPDAYLCKVNGESLWYKVLGLNVFTYSRNLNSIVVQAPHTSDIMLADESEYGAVNQLSGEGSKQKSLLICKGDYNAIKGKLELSHKEREEIETLMHANKKKGLRMILYATKVLSSQETEKFTKQFNNLHSSLTNQDNLLEELAIEYETNLSILGMIGFKEELKSDAYDFVITAKNCNINTWLLSGDQEAQTVSCAQAVELVEHHTKVLRIHGLDKDQVLLQLNTAIGHIEHEISSLHEEQGYRAQLIHSSTTIFDGEQLNRMAKFTLVFGGNSLKTIVEDSNLMAHFRFLACACKHLIGYELNPKQKELLCLMIRDYFPGNPIVLAVGDGYNDALMMQAANVSVEVINSNKTQIYPQVNAGDILVTSLADIKTLLLQIGKLQSERIHSMTLFVFYCSGFLAMTMFFFNWFCQFTATSLHDSMTVFLVMFLFIFPSAMALGLLDLPTNPIVNHKFPGLYVDGQIRTRHYHLFYLLEGFLESLLSAAYTFYACAYMVNYSTNNMGWAADLKMVSTSIIYVIVAVLAFKVFFRLLFHKVYLSAFTYMITMGLLVGFVFANFKGEFSHWDYEALTVELFTRYNSIVAIVFSISGCYLINFILHDIIRFRFLPSAYEQAAFLNSGGVEWDTFNNKELINTTVDQQIYVSAIVQRVFRSATLVSPYIQEMLNPGDTKVTEMKLKPITLHMRETVLEQKFSESKLIPSLHHLRVFVMLFLLYFVAYAFTDFFVRDTPEFSGAQYIVVFGIELSCLLFTLTTTMSGNYYTYSHIIMLSLVIIKIVVDWLSDELTIAQSSTLVMLFTTLNTTNMPIIPIVIYNLGYLIQLIVRILLLAIEVEFPTEQIYSRSRVAIYAASTIIILLVSINIRLLFSYYKSIKQRRNDFLARYQIEQDNIAAQDILQILVPKFVLQSISSGVYSMQEAQDNVSILFCYICDFDSIMREEGKNVVLMLDSLFRTYDNLCLQHGVQKIETVGYTYMAATGIKACEQGINQHMLRTEKTMRLVNLAFDMVQQVQGRKYGKGNQIEIKIGIHVGRVIAGVIGYHKPQFSLIGDPVNQTSRVGSTGDVGAITLSEIAFKQAKQGVKYYTKKQKEAKGLGIIDTYQVFRTKPPNYQAPITQQRWQNAAKMALKDKKDQAQNSPKSAQMQGSPAGPSFLKKLQIQINNNNEKDGQSQKVGNSPIGSYNPSGLMNFMPEVKLSAAQPSLQQIPQQDSDNSEIMRTEALDEQYWDGSELLQPNALLMISAEQYDNQQSFKNILREQNEHEGQIALAFLWITYFMITLLSLIVRKFFEYNLVIFVLRAIFLILLLLLFPFLKRSFKQSLFNWMYYMTLLYGAFTVLFQAYLTDSEVVATICLMEVLYLLIVASNLKLFTFVQNLLYMLATLGLFLGFYIAKNHISYDYVYYIVCGMVLILIGDHLSLSEQIRIFNNLQINEVKKIKQIALVSQLLPTHAYLKMKNTSVYNKLDFIDEFDDVTLLFADIKGFTEYSHTQTPEGVVNMLRNLFTECDKMCQKYSVYKVYTIGDCYVAMGFTNAAKRNPVQEAINSVKMGFAMVEIIKKVRKEIKFELLNMRIGIHTGTVIGGIIGTDIVRYDIYGKDVSIANKMESSGVEGRIHISETTKTMIERAEKHPFMFQLHGDVDLSKFNMTTKGYLVDYNMEISGSPKMHY